MKKSNLMPNLKNLVQSTFLAAALLSSPAHSQPVPSQEISPLPAYSQLSQNPEISSPSARSSQTAQLALDHRVDMALHLDYTAGFAGFKYNSQADKWALGTQIFSAGLEFSKAPYYSFLDSGFSTAKRIKDRYLKSDVLDNHLSLGGGYRWAAVQSDLAFLLTKEAESLLAGGTVRAKGTLDMYIGYLRDMAWEAKFGLAGKDPHLILGSEFNFIDRYFLDTSLKLFREEQDYEIGPALGHDWGPFAAKLALNYKYKTFKEGTEHSLVTKLSFSASQLP